VGGVDYNPTLEFDGTQALGGNGQLEFYSSGTGGGEINVDPLRTRARITYAIFLFGKTE
jgi:hypothetical protein